MFSTSIKVKNQIFYYILNLNVLPESIRNNYRAGDIFTIVTSNTICMLKDNEHISLETISFDYYTKLYASAIFNHIRIYTNLINKYKEYIVKINIINTISYSYQSNNVVILSDCEDENGDEVKAFTILDSNECSYFKDLDNYLWCYFDKFNPEYQINYYQHLISKYEHNLEFYSYVKSQIDYFNL